ncbi:unnamed protein product [Parnassius apollo]|uniref:(apollo) hypothetical protein n=1 Tax=Parnassius apollo TaxID=110799 RepID=A0A8S3Y253_PARAO|nr:unnamed protein product [Parnassius apollo]
MKIGVQEIEEAIIDRPLPVHRCSDTLKRPYLQLVAANLHPSLPRLRPLGRILTLAEPPSLDSEQLRLTPKYGEVLSTPVRSTMYENEALTSGKTSDNKSRTEALNGDPDINFSDLPQYKKVMEMLLRDIQRGNHLLLVDDRGLENKKIVDRLLHQFESPYIIHKVAPRRNGTVFDSTPNYQKWNSHLRRFTTR